MRIVDWPIGVPLQKQNMFDSLKQAVGEGAFEEVPSRDGMPTIYVAPEHLPATALALRDVLGFD